MLKKILASVLVLLLILPLAISCSVAHTAETALVPGAANTVVKIQLSKILSNPALLLAYAELAKNNPAWPPNASDALNQWLTKTGFDLATITTLTLFVDAETTDQPENAYGGVIASGTFDASALVNKIQQETSQTLTTSDYKGLKIYTAEKPSFALVFLSQNQAVFGTPKAVWDVIDVSKKDQPPLSGTVLDTFNRLGPALIAGASVAMENLRQQLAKETPGQTPLSQESLADIDVMGFTIDQPSLSLSLRTDAHFSNPASAQDAKDSITGLIALAKGTSPDQNVKTLLGNLQVTATDAWLSVRALINPTELATLLENMPPKE